MLRYDAHLSDEELILAADGELSPRRAVRTRAHMATCWTCRTRMNEIETTIADLVHIYRDDPDRLPPSAGPRALLKARLAELAAAPGPTPLRRFFNFILDDPFPRYVLASILLFAIGTTVLVRHSLRAWNSRSAGQSQLTSLPNRNITPGATRRVTVSDMCSMAHEEVVRDVSASLRHEVFQEYGIGNERANDYEIDYLIAPGLGGAEDLQNLWPQPYAPLWNAHVKDALEELLHQRVCAGKLDISTAQRDISTDWIAAYKKYFHTDRPLPLNSDSIRGGLIRAIHNPWG
jgi:hypothetical protein